MAFDIAKCHKIKVQRRKFVRLIITAILACVIHYVSRMMTVGSYMQKST